MFGLRASPKRAEDDRSAQSRGQKSRRLILAILIAPIALLAGTGCAQKQAPAVAMVKPSHLSQGGVPSLKHAYADVDLEDDGREAQQPPLVSRKPIVDDPNEPFSPNYGRVSSVDDEDVISSSGSDDAAVVGSVQASAVVTFQHSMLR